MCQDGPKGPYHAVVYDVAIIFGTLLEFKLVYQEVILATASSNSELLEIMCSVLGPGFSLAVSVLNELYALGSVGM
jgi:hypothetical protein